MGKLYELYQRISIARLNTLYYFINYNSLSININQWGKDFDKM